MKIRWTHYRENTWRGQVSDDHREDIWITYDEHMGRLYYLDDNHDGSGAGCYRTLRAAKIAAHKRAFR